LDRREALGEFEHVHRPVDAAGRDERALILHAHALETVGVHLQRERRVVLLVEDVPHVESAVHLGGHEDARPRRRPPRVKHVALEEFGRHDRRAELLVPHLDAPVADRKVELGEPRVALQRVHGAAMSLPDVANLIGGRLALARARGDLALLAADHELTARPSVLQCRAADPHLLLRLLLHPQRLDGLRELAHVPPQHLRVRRRRDGLEGRLTRKPSDLVHGVAVRLLNDGNLLRRVPDARIEATNEAVVRAANEEVGVLRVVLEAAERRRRGERDLRRVGIVHVPDERIHATALLPLVLELHDSESHGELAPHVGVPRDAAHRALRLARVPEDGERLCRRRRARVVGGGLAGEVLLVDVDRVVLLDIALDGIRQILDLLQVVLVLLHLLAVALGLLLLGSVDLLGPATLDVQHALRLVHDGLRVDKGLRHHRNRLHVHDTGIALDVVPLLFRLRQELVEHDDVAHREGVDRPPKLMPLLLVDGRDVHGASHASSSTPRARAKAASVTMNVKSPTLVEAPLR